MQLHNRISREELKKRLMEETFQRKTISFYKYHYLRNQGFEDVNQLHGGILEYARQIKVANLESKFIGKNFVFDERLGESVDGQIISHCHQCGKPCDTHTNCANNRCHLLFIQCPECATKYEGCCTPECLEEKSGKTSGEKVSAKKFGNSRKYRKSLALVRSEQKLESTKSQITNIK